MGETLLKTWGKKNVLTEANVLKNFVADKIHAFTGTVILNFFRWYRQLERYDRLKSGNCNDQKENEANPVHIIKCIQHKTSLAMMSIQNHIKKGKESAVPQKINGGNASLLYLEK